MTTKTATAVEHCTTDSIGLKIVGEHAEAVVAVVNSYLATFSKPIKTGPELACLHCETMLSGFIGSFTWGLVTGEGKCRECGWPARAHHRPKDDSGKIIVEAFQFILQYHPDFVRDKNAEDQQEETDDTDP